MSALKLSSYDWGLRTESEKYNGAFQVGDLISFKTASASIVNGKWVEVFYSEVIQFKQQLGFFVMVDNKVHELSKLLNIEVCMNATTEMVGLNDSSDICYTAESGKEYSNNDLLNISQRFIDDFKLDIDFRLLAQKVFDLCEWQHPETILDEMIREGEIA